MRGLMGKRKKTANKPEKAITSRKVGNVNAGDKSFWVRHRGTLIAIAGLYLLIAI